MFNMGCQYFIYRWWYLHGVVYISRYIYIFWIFQVWIYYPNSFEYLRLYLGLVFGLQTRPWSVLGALVNVGCLLIVYSTPTSLDNWWWMLIGWRTEPSLWSNSVMNLCEDCWKKWIGWLMSQFWELYLHRWAMYIVAICWQEGYKL
jgi:hypothetical protein